jgi:serine/threonine protein kinase
VLKKVGYGKEVDLWSVGVSHASLVPQTSPCSNTAGGLPFFALLFAQIILYLILRGKLPFDSEDPQEIVRQTIEGACLSRSLPPSDVSSCCVDATCC